MRKPKGFPNHNCCPAEWKQTPQLTGSYELDAMIVHTKNKDMQDRIRDHLSDNSSAYNHKTAYNGSSRD